MKKLSRYIAVLLLGILAITTLVGCEGDEGKDGLAYFSASYSSTIPLTYWDDNPGLPVGFTYGKYYRSRSGTYNFEYDVADGYWFGTYALTINRGTPGGAFWSDGDDGDDSFLKMYCDPDGPARIYSKEVSKNNTLIVFESEDRIITELYNGRYKLTVEYNRGSDKDRENRKAPKR